MSIKELKEREREQRREYIVDAAEKLFFSKGYDGVSMNDIAGAVEMNKATLYLYFENKESLYFAVVLRGARLMMKMLEKAMEQESTGMNKISAIGRVFFEYHRQYADYYKLFCHLSHLDASQSEEGREYHRLMYDYMALMCKTISIGVEDGSIRGDIDPMVIVAFLADSSEKVADMTPEMRDALASRGITYEKYITNVMALLGSAIRGPKANPIEITPTDMQKR